MDLRIVEATVLSRADRYEPIALSLTVQAQDNPFECDSLRNFDGVCTARVRGRPRWGEPAPGLTTTRVDMVSTWVLK